MGAAQANKVASLGARSGTATDRSALAKDDYRWGDGCRHLIEVSSTAHDPDFNGVGSSPWTGDTGNTAVPVPAAATTSQNNRYLFRLCGIEIPGGRSMVIKGLRQLATIRAPTRDENNLLLTVEREVVSPFWHFLDGNISWHLRWQQERFAPYPNAAAVAPTPGTSPQMLGYGTALLYRTTIVPYTALANGIPPGGPMADLGTWRDMRFPWGNTDWSMNHVVRGPGAIVLYASVHQTSTTNRPLYPDANGMRPEDRFISEFQNEGVIYGHVGGAMLVELLPCCTEGAVEP